MRDFLGSLESDQILACAACDEREAAEVAADVVVEIGGDALADLFDMFPLRAAALVDGRDAEDESGAENSGAGPSGSAAGERFECLTHDRMMRRWGRFESGRAEPHHDGSHEHVRAEATAPTVGGEFHRGEMSCGPTLVAFFETING